MEIILYSGNKPDSEDNLLNFNDLNKKNIRHNKNLFFILDFNSVNKKSAKKIIKKLLKYKRKINFGIYNKETNEYIMAKAYNYDKNNYFHNELISALYAILKKDKKEMYEYIYDTVCDYLDNEFITKNACNFKDDKCGEKRNTSCTVGCCRHYKNKILGPMPFNKLVVCEHLENKRCSAKCISCKLFTCDYLNKKGIKFKINDIFLLDTFFNLMQKYFIKISVYTPKDTIIKRLVCLSIGKDNVKNRI